MVMHPHLFVPDLFLEVSEEDAKRKIEALKCYKCYQDNLYLKLESVGSILRAAGLYVNVKFAESFEIARMVHKA